MALDYNSIYSHRLFYVFPFAKFHWILSLFQERDELIVCLNFLKMQVFDFHLLGVASLHWITLAELQPIFLDSHFYKGRNLRKRLYNCLLWYAV